MKVIFHKDFYRQYTSDPAAEPGRMEAIVSALQGKVDFITPSPQRLISSGPPTASTISNR